MKLKAFFFLIYIYIYALLWFYIDDDPAGQMWSEKKKNIKDFGSLIVTPMHRQVKWQESWSLSWLSPLGFNFAFWNLWMPQTKATSLSASEFMMLRQAKLVGVGLITLLHVRFLSFCAASENQPCRPSSCGDIQNISNPFRLKGDPLGCGHPDPAYELACENSRTILYGKYHVAEINYDNYTIRVVVVGLEKTNCFSLPLYSLTVNHVDGYKYPDELDTVVLMNCARPIFDQYYIPIVPCNRTDATFSSSQPYFYALVGGSKQVRDLPYSCTIGMTVVTGNLKAVSAPSNLSSSDLQEMLLMGL